MNGLEFEDIVQSLEVELNTLKKKPDAMKFSAQIEALEKQKIKILHKIYSKLEPWQYVLIARHVDRPTGSDYIKKFIHDFVPICGDRCAGEDPALMCGIGVFNGISVAVIGHNKGAETHERVANNFGMAHPDGYRKARRLFNLANKFHLPILAFIDTKGAAANIEAEERGQAYALADCIRANLQLQVPLISVIVGEGGSGGAIALASGHCLMMLKYSIFSVASPDACAAILWKNRSFWKDAARELKITSDKLLKLNAIDREIAEPAGGAHRFAEIVYANVETAVETELARLMKYSINDLTRIQHEKYFRF